MKRNTSTIQQASATFRRSNRNLNRVFRGTPSRYSNAVYIGDRPSVLKSRLLAALMIGACGIAALNLTTKSVANISQSSTSIKTPLVFDEIITTSNTLTRSQANNVITGVDGSKVIMEFGFTEDFTLIPPKNPVSETHITQTRLDDTSALIAQPAQHEISQESDQLVLSHVDDGSQDIELIPAAGPQHVTVDKGDTFYRIAANYGLSAGQIANITANKNASRLFSKLREGDQINFNLNDSGRITDITFQPNAEEKITITRNGDSFKTDYTRIALERRLNVASGIIDNSLFSAAAEAQVPRRIMASLKDIFRWDVDFGRDVREGDSFAIVYESFHGADGRRVRTGTVLAAEYVNRGKTHRAYLYEGNNSRGYFTAKGRSLRKSFLRNPVDIVRISSRFTKRRYHPVLHKFRAHRGVDYAARTGTPIYATAGGTVSFVGRQRGYGKVVIIKHRNGYETRYAHMSRFGNIRKSQYVKQGRRIGYVGQSGLATGPHLHYEVLVRGVHVDPLKLSTFGASTLSASQKRAFNKAIAPMTAQLERARNAKQLAQKN